MKNKVHLRKSDNYFLFFYRSEVVFRKLWIWRSRDNVTLLHYEEVRCTTSL